MGKNLKRTILLVAILIVAAFSCALMLSCNLDNVKEISLTPGEINVRIGEFNYADYTVTATYDSGKTEEFALTADMIAAKDRLKFFVEGEYEIEVTYLNRKTTIPVKVRRNVFEGATFDDVDVVYNGEYYTVEVKNLPEGTSVTYPTPNRFRNAGEYQATAVLRKDAYEMKEMTANVVIRKADYDLSNTTFENKTEVFDGESHLLAMEGTLPAGLYVDYTITREGGREERGNSARNAGVYVVEATFMGDFNNYNAIQPKQARLIIEQAEIDVSQATFTSKEVVYDRTLQTIELEGELPLGVTVAYLNNEHVDAGVYEALAVFAVDDAINYAPIPAKKATLTIRKAEFDMSDVHFNGIKVTYDGKEKRIEVQGQIPNGISVSYRNNVGTDAGTYQATAVFTSNNVNYNDPAVMTAAMIIDPAPAPMDQITFERRRFISQKKDWDGYKRRDDEVWAEIQAHPEGEPYLYKLYYYDPYLAAKEYLPDNVPKGLTVADVKYMETPGKVNDLSEYDGQGPGYIGKDQLDHDGYYVVVVTFDGGNNYTGVSPIRTQIRVDTIDSLSNLTDMVFDDSWVNPETNEVTGAFMRATVGAEQEEMAVSEVDGVNLSYCYCNIFQDYIRAEQVAGEGASEEELKVAVYDALISQTNDYIREAVLAQFQKLADSYDKLMNRYDSSWDSEQGKYVYIIKGDDNVNEEEKNEHGDYPTLVEFFMNALNTTVADVCDEEEYYEVSQYYPFDIAKAAYVPLDGGIGNTVLTNYDGDETLEDYYTVIAQIFGIDDVNEFFGWDKLTGKVFGTYFDAAFLEKAKVSVDSVQGRLTCNGGIYQQTENGYVFIFPYVLWWYTQNEDDVIYGNSGQYEYEYIYLLCSEFGGDRNYGAILSNPDAFFGWLAETKAYVTEAEARGDEEVNYPVLEGRCSVIWDIQLYDLFPIMKTVIVDGVEVQRAITSGKDFVFIEDSSESDATKNLIHEDRDVYKFLTEIPGNCAERQTDYDEDDYRLQTPQTVYTYCDCDPFATVIAADGDAGNLSKKDARGDYAQMTTEVALEFDELAAVYQAFIFNYVAGDDVVNEWKIGASNRNYPAYRTFFEFASDMMLHSNRNMGKNNEYVLSKSVIIGMNKSFTISINGSGNDYTLDQYRRIVANLFGFDDLDEMTAYSDAIASALVANAKNASVNTVSARLLYDGAVLTQNGYYVLPFVFKSETAANKVVAIVFVDGQGVMSIWLNDARNAFNATNWGEEELEGDDKYTMDIYGRCMLFEDDGYIMKEDLSKNVVDMINSLQNFGINRFKEIEYAGTCADSNSYWQFEPWEGDGDDENDDEYGDENIDENDTESGETYDEGTYYTAENPYTYHVNGISYFYCDCNPLTCRNKSHYDARVLSHRSQRDDHAQITQDVADEFDALSELYQAFFAHYAVDDAVASGKTVVSDYYLEYRRLFKQARDMFASVKSGMGEVNDYVLSDTMIIGMNKAFAFSTIAMDRTVDEYRMMVATLFGFTDLDTFTEYADDLAQALVANGGNANVDTLAGRIVYDGVILTENGYYVLPYVIVNRETKDKVLAFVFVDAQGTMSIWIHNVSSAFAVIDITPSTEVGEMNGVIFINGRCALFENFNYIGYVTDQRTKYIAVQKIKTFQSEGDFLIYSPFSDDEGFSVYWFSVYDLELEVIYDDSDGDEIGTVHKGFYVLISVASGDDVRAKNQRSIAEAEAMEGEF